MLNAKNPILKGFHPDPSIIRVGDDFFIATSTFQWFPGVQLYHSKDLVNWQELKSPLSRVSQLDMRGNPNSGGIWGPCLSYSNGTFYLIYTNTKNFHGIFKDTPNYLVTTNDIFSGEWSEPIYLNSSGFDPSMFHDDDGKKYLLNMRWDHRMEKNDFSGILLQEYSEKEKKLVGDIHLIFEGTSTGATEAPHIYKRNGYYYLMLAEGGTMYNHGVQLARSKSIFGPYEADEKPLLTTRHHPTYPLQRTGHASLVDTKNGDLYVAYLCARPITDKKRSILGRETAMSEVYFNKDGWLRLKNNDILPPLDYNVNLKEHKFEEKPHPSTFDTTELPICYKTLRIPFDEIGSLSEREGYLRLFGNQSITSWDKQSLVARRLQHHNAEVVAELEFSPKSFQQMAGITVYYDTYNFVYFYMSYKNDEENELRIIIRENLRFKNPLNCGVSIGKNTRVLLKAEIKGLTLQLYYSLDGVKYIKMSDEIDISSLSDEAYVDIGHEGHTGTFVGMACQDLSSSFGNDRCYADFRSFSYKGK